MNTRIKGFISSLTLTALTGLMFSGCSAAFPDNIDTTPVNISVVTGIVNNNPVYSPDIPELNNLAYKAGSTYCFIEADGDPSVITSGTIADVSDKGYSSTTMKKVLGQMTNSINELVTSHSPDSDETDLLSAIELAARQLNSVNNDYEKIMVIEHSGICFSSRVNMSCGISSCDIENSVSGVLSMTNVNLEGIKVVFYYLGDTNGNQPALTSSDRTQLRAFWTGILEGLNADVIFSDRLPSNDEYSFDQHVSTMPVSGNNNALIPVTEASVTSDVSYNTFMDSAIVFTNETISFLPDSTVLADQEAARNSLQSIIDYMLTDTDFEVSIIGTTSSAGQRDSSIVFSLNRAEAIKALLVDSGIDEWRIHTVGAGYSSCLYNPDRDLSGNLIESQAASNRSVVLVAYGSDYMNQIIDSIN